MHVCPFLDMEQGESHWAEFSEMHICDYYKNFWLRYLVKISRKQQTLHDDKRTSVMPCDY